MFLFNKKTRNIIKYIWGTLATLVVLSMIIAYSGFSTLATTQKAPPAGEQQVEIPAEVREQFKNQKEGEPVDLGSEGNSYEKQQVLKAIEEGRLNIDQNASGTPARTPSADGTVPTTPAPTAPPLKFEI